MIISPVTRAEEASVLAAARVIGSDIDNETCPNSSVLINGFYKIGCIIDNGLVGDKEFVIDF